MDDRRYTWLSDGNEHELRLVPVPETAGAPFMFGGPQSHIPIDIAGFRMSTTPVTQALWTKVMGSNPAKRVGPRHPVESVSWRMISEAGGFLERINASEILPAVAGSDRLLKFRLPTESEWEYAARGGPRWPDGFRFSGSNDAGEVAWCGPHYTPERWAAARSLGFSAWRLLTFQWFQQQPHTHPVSGNVWEWCEDTCDDVIAADPPRDGSPYLGPGSSRRLRGGWYDSWDCFALCGGDMESRRTRRVVHSASGSCSADLPTKRRSRGAVSATVTKLTDAGGRRLTTELA